jgi:hypothetical protein
LAPEIFEELARWFTIKARSFFPLRVPFIWCNLCIGLALRPKATPMAG